VILSTPNFAQKLRKLRQNALCAHKLLIVDGSQNCTANALRRTEIVVANKLSCLAWRIALNRWLIPLLLLLASGASAATTTHAPDLSAVPQAIQNKEGKQSFDEQIEDKTAPNLLGSVLPAGLTREAIVRLLAPHADPARITLVGAQPWTHLAHGYVAIVCAAHDAADAPKTGAAPSCDSHPDVFLAVITLQPGSNAPQLVANGGRRAGRRRCCRPSRPPNSTPTRRTMMRNGRAGAPTTK
jgi:hypothetical protein